MINKLLLKNSNKLKSTFQISLAENKFEIEKKAK